jgi:quercetin dioxygenase-like cupin family protein
MDKHRFLLVVPVFLMLAGPPVFARQTASQPKKAPASQSSAAKAPAAKAPAAPLMHVIADPDKATFTPVPAAVGLSPAVEMSPIAGDPSKPGIFSLMLKVPANGVVAPHWHPGEENVVVLKGTFELGDGTTFDESKLQSLGSGKAVHIPARMRHFARAKGTTTLLVYGIGPFVINYVNAKDDPRKAVSQGKSPAPK